MKIIAFDLGFINCGIAEFNGSKLYVRNVKWTESVPQPLQLGFMYTALFKPVFKESLDKADVIILEKPYMLSSGRGGRQSKYGKSSGSTIAPVLISLFNCICADYGYKIVSYGPSIKRTTYAFDTKNKIAITRWAEGMAEQTGALKNGWKQYTKKDDMADALFLMTHYLTQLLSIKIDPMHFKNPKTCYDQIWRRLETIPRVPLSTADTREPSGTDSKKPEKETLKRERPI